MTNQNIIKINIEELTEKVVKLKNDGYRLVAISCTNKNGFEMSYSFDKNYDFITLRFITDNSIEIESICSIYSYSFLYENEIRDLFGVKIKDISVDFEGKLYRIKAETPFGNVSSENKGVQ